jgi:hypothetical protein
MQFLSKPDAMLDTGTDGSEELQRTFSRSLPYPGQAQGLT